MTAVIRARRSVGWAVVFAVTMAPGFSGTVVGAEPQPPSNQLESPMVDLVVLEPDAGGSDTTPALLIIDAEGPASDRASLALLQRGDSWERVVELELDLERDGLAARWLVGLDSRRFALIATSPTSTRGSGYAVVIGLDIRGVGGDPAIVEVGRSRIDRAVEDAAAADVDGLGTPELILGLRPSIEASGSCGLTSLVVIDGATFAIRRTVDLPGRLGTGIVGRFDAAPGDDLLAYDSRACPPGGAGDTRLSTIRFTDGEASPLIEGLSSDVDAYPPPVRFRVEGEAHDLALATTDAGLAVVRPGVRGHLFTIDASAPIPLVAGPDAVVDGKATRIAWLDDDGLHALRIPHEARLPDDAGRMDLAPSSFGSERWAILASGIVDDIRAHGLSSAWLGDVADPDCPDLIVPGAILPCGAAELRQGAAWLATRLVAAMPIEGRRGMLVAAGLGWDPAAGLPSSPTPWAVAPAGWWRHGPSTSFALSEIRANDIGYFQEYPTPKATIEATTASDGSTLLPGFTGTRMFVSVSALPEGEEGPDVAPDRLAGLLGGPDRDGGITTVVRVPVPPGNESGRDGSFATLALADVHGTEAAAPSRWAMRVVPINDWGEVGLPVVRTVVRDVVGPTLNLETPFTNPVWPFTTSLAGRAEPGSNVAVDGQGDLEVDQRGRFTVVTHLAPWPQTIRLTATDASGNTSIGEFSVVGGVDYRRFPWALIAALVLLGVVAARGLAAAGRDRGAGVEATMWSTGALDDADAPEIEELPPGKGLARR